MYVSKRYCFDVYNQHIRNKTINIEVFNVYINWINVEEINWHLMLVYELRNKHKAIG